MRAAPVDPAVARAKAPAVGPLRQAADPEQPEAESKPAEDSSLVTVVQRFRSTSQIQDPELLEAFREALAEADAATPAVLDLTLPDARQVATPHERSAVPRAPTGVGEHDDPAELSFLTGPRPVAEDPYTAADALAHLTSTPMLQAGAEGEWLLPTEHAGRYDVQETIGQGGMSFVLRVHDRTLRRDVAMKVLQPDLETRPEYVHALRREARILAGLQHPSIAPLHELGLRADGSTYYTMKLMTERSLGAVMHRLQLGDPATVEQYTLRRLIGIFVQIAQGCDFAHETGVVHRDLKPENVLLGGVGEVQIMDWGIAKHMRHEAPLHAEGLVVGTPAYMSPEQAAGHEREVDPRSDIYALGVMLYEILASKRPYSGENSQQQLEATKNVVPLLPSVVARDRKVPPDLETLCMRMLEKKRERRPQSMREVWQALERYLAGEQERQRLRERAEQSFQRGLAELAQYEALRLEREFVLQEEAALQREVLPWHSQAQKQHVWSLRHQLQMLDVLYAHAFTSASELLRQAVDEGEGHTAAREKLIELYWQRHDEAATRGDSATKLFFARQAHDLAEEALARPNENGNATPPTSTGRARPIRPPTGGFARRTGALHVRSQPQGAVVYAIPFAEIRASLGKPAPQHEIGTTPIAGVDLPLGPYVLMARLDGHRDALETVYVREQNRDLLLLCYPWSSELPLTGREGDIARLWFLMEDAELRSRPLTCQVAGALGMGKNVLLDAFRRQIEQHPTKIYFLLEVTCDRLRRNLPYSTVVDLVRLRAGILETDNADAARQKLRRMVAQGFSRMGRVKLTAEQLCQADALADTIAALPAFDIEEPSRMGIREEMAREGRRRVIEALATYLHAIAAATPVLMLIRNAQHMDPSSRAFFRDLLGLVQQVPMLVVASVTEQQEPPPLQPRPARGQPLVPHGPLLAIDEHISLEPLPERGVVCLVREMLGAPVERGLMTWIGRHAVGNPFVAGELVHLLARCDGIERRNAEWHLAPERLPDGLKPGAASTVVRALIATLPAHVQRALSTAVVIGSEFWAGALLALAVPQHDDALEQLVQAGFIVRNASSRYAGDREYQLSSTLRRRVAYDMLPLHQRRSLHRKVATWIARRGRTDLEESLRLAHHLEMGGQPQEAALLVGRIAKAALSVGAEEEAERLFTHAYVLSSDPELQGQIEVQLRALSAKSRV